MIDKEAAPRRQQDESGLELSRSFWDEVVEPVVSNLLPPDAYSAGLLGPGSEVLGFDTHRSRDHDWGPRVQIYLAEEDQGDLSRQIEDALPEAFHGHSLHFGAKTGSMPWIHVVDVATVKRLCQAWAGFDPAAGGTVVDWLAAPWQGLRSIVDGSVFYDGLNQLTNAQEQVRWYSDDVWRYVLACQWQRISQEEAFVGRTIELNDELGSRLVTSRLVRDCVHLAFLLERQYPVYTKWLGTAFKRLQLSSALGPILEEATDGGPERRQDALADAYELLAARTNDLQLCDAIDARRRNYHSRPYIVIHAERFVGPLQKSIQDPELQRIPLIGCISQATDSTDLPKEAGRAIYQRLIPPKGSAT